MPRARHRARGVVQYLRPARPRSSRPRISWISSWVIPSGARSMSGSISSSRLCCHRRAIVGRGAAPLSSPDSTNRAHADPISRTARTGLAGMARPVGSRRTSVVDRMGRCHRRYRRQIDPRRVAGSSREVGMVAKSRKSQDDIVGPLLRVRQYLRRGSPAVKARGGTAGPARHEPDRLTVAGDTRPSLAGRRAWRRAGGSRSRSFPEPPVSQNAEQTPVRYGQPGPRG